MSPGEPIVIRPAPVRLADLEVRIRVDRALADALRDHPRFCRGVASALHRRDPAVQRRFASVDEVAAYLQSVVLG